MYIPKGSRQIPGPVGYSYSQQSGSFESGFVTFLFQCLQAFGFPTLSAGVSVLLKLSTPLV